MISFAIKTLLSNRSKLFTGVAGVIFSLVLVNIQGGLYLGLMKKASLLVDHNEADLCRSLGKTVVVVTHDSRIFSFADRVLTLNNGQMKPSVHTDSLNAVRMDTNTPEPMKKAA